jgi:diguanylate cyclase (GGDEF)-like protein
VKQLKKNLPSLFAAAILIAIFLFSGGWDIWGIFFKVLGLIATIFLVVNTLPGGSGARMPEPESEDVYRQRLADALAKRRDDPEYNALRKPKKKNYIDYSETLPENLRGEAEKSFNTLIENMIRVSATALIADRVAFYLLDESGEGFKLRFAYSENAHNLMEFVPRGNGFIDVILNQNKSVMENNIPENSLVVSYAMQKSKKAYSFIGVPVLYNNKPIGVLVIDSYAKENFSIESREIAEAIAATFSSGIVNTNLLYETANSALKNQIMANLHKALASVGNEDEINDILCEYIGNYFQADRLSIGKVLGNGEVIIERVVGPADQVREGQTISPEKSLIGLVIRQNKPILMTDLNAAGKDYSPRFYAGESSEMAMDSILSVPVVNNDDTLAVLILESNKKNAFKISDKNALTEIAESAKYAYLNHESKDRLAQMTFKDDLTELWNENAMRKRLEEELGRCIRFKEKLTIMYLNIDHFDNINQSYGVTVADALLKEFGEVVVPMIRAIDYMARGSADRFYMLLPGTSVLGGRILAERIRQKIEAHRFYLEGGVIQATISIALVEIPEMAQTSDEVFANLDTTMTFMRKQGRNKSMAYSKKTKEQA